MYHYLFTNDLRISNLNNVLQEAGRCFKDDCVPSASEDKNANNNMNTLGFYFNLTTGSNCSIEASKGNARTVVLNFIKKFQFPNPRTDASLKDAIGDNISLAPMRTIVSMLYTMQTVCPDDAFLTNKEIADFIFFNDAIAKTEKPDVLAAIQELIEYRKSHGIDDVIPEDEILETQEKYWKQCKRQIREMVKVLTWAGCVTENANGSIRIHHDNLSRENKADLFDILTYKSFWKADPTKSFKENKQSYQEYMDLNITDSENNNHDIVEEENEYKRAANRLLNFVAETNFQNPIQENDIEQARKNFLDLYSVDKLKALTDDTILDTIFYTEGDNTNCLCYYLERNTDCRNYFGSILGGYSFKFGLFKKKSNGLWYSGSSNNPIVLSDSAALDRGKQIRDALIKGVEIIQETELNTIEDYEKLEQELKSKVGERFYSLAWFHKYFSIICPDKLSGYHNAEWQKHILYSFGIKPSEYYYVRSGQIAMIENYASMRYRQFYAAHVEWFGNPKSFYRIGTTKGGNSVFDEWVTKNIVGIGWNNIGSLDECLKDKSIDKDKVANKLSETYYQDDKKTASRKAGELVLFYETNDNSIFVAANGENLLGLVDNLGEYEFDTSTPMAHVKSGTWHMVFDKDEKLPNKKEGLQTSCYQIKDDDNLLYLYDKYYNAQEIETEVNNGNEDSNDMDDLKTCLEVVREPRKDKLYPVDFIIYGAPGTGKTYSTAEYALGIIENRPVDLSYKDDVERTKTMNAYKKLISDGQVVFTTFHQSYGYEEFIQGLRPDIKSDKMSFKKVDGIFKRIADKALNDLNHNYVIIIDEINRANISKVFGELITLIEEDKRWGEINQLCVTLQSGDVFAVPNNLYIVGTMNSADKSISLIDAALRRRFEFVEQKPQPELIRDPQLKKVFMSINSSLVDELESADLLVGHSYFMYKSITDLETILNNSIIPLLYEYFYDNKKKVASVLNKAIEGTKVKLIDDKLGRLRVESVES